MKKIVLTLMTVLFLGSTGLVLADTPAASTPAPAVKTLKMHKTHVKKIKKAVKKAKKEAAKPAAAPATPAAK